MKLPVEEQNHELLAFLNGVFRGAQVRWGIPDKEGFAIKESCTKLCHLLVRKEGFLFILTTAICNGSLIRRGLFRVFQNRQRIA